MIFSKKFFVTLLGLAVVVSLGLAVFLYINRTPARLSVNFLDIGQGDSELIKTPYGQNILIDGGDSGAPIIQQLSRVLSFYDRTIDLMILTHPHDDHVGGLVKVLQRYQVEKILYTGVTHDSPAYLAWLAEVKRKSVPVTIIDRSQTIQLGRDLRLDILHPQTSFLNQEVANLNNTSIVVKLIYKNSSWLFMGDAETEVEADLTLNPSPWQGEGSDTGLKSDVLKTGHHGSDTSSTLEFLTAVQPQYAIISVGKDNDFDHPSPRIINRLERAGIIVYRTDINGRIAMKSDGDKLEVRREK